MKELQMDEIERYRYRLLGFLGDLGTSGSDLINHLEDDDYVAYMMETQTKEDITRIEKHMNSCNKCASEMDELMMSSEVWRTPEGQRTLAIHKGRERNTLLGNLTGEASVPWYERLERFLASASLKPAIQFSDIGVETSQSDDYLFSMSTEDTKRGIQVVISCFDLDLNSARIEIYGTNQDGSETVIDSRIMECVSDTELTVNFLVPHPKRRKYGEIKFRVADEKLGV